MSLKLVGVKVVKRGHSVQILHGSEREMSAEENVKNKLFLAHRSENQNANYLLPMKCASSAVGVSFPYT